MLESAFLTTDNHGKYGLFKNAAGEIVAKPKGSSGAGEPKEYNTSDSKAPKTPGSE
jgi:hypothetical protein